MYRICTLQFITYAYIVVVHFGTVDYSAFPMVAHLKRVLIIQNLTYWNDINRVLA